MKRKIDRGKALEELVKGSLDYTLDAIRRAFNRMFPSRDDDYHWIVETFRDHLIVSGNELKPDEYYLVTYRRDGEEYTFAARDAWEVVELAYQPQTITTAFESRKRVAEKPGRGKRFTERLSGGIRLEEGENGQRVIHAIGITADVVNGNGRRYPAAVLEAAVAEVQHHLHESAGQGRLALLGEVEHPSEKSGRPNLLETVVKWDEVLFDGKQTVLKGHILETSTGRDILALMEGGVVPGISQRGYGDSKIVKDGNRKVEEVTALHITGYDLVFDPSDPNAVVTLLESQVEDGEMNLEELLKLIRENPEIFRGVVVEEVQKMSAAQLKALEEKARKALGIGENDDLGRALEEAAAAKQKLEAHERQAAIEAAISQASKYLPYGDDMNGMFVESLRAAQPADTEAVKALAEAKRKEYDKLAAAGKLAGMGFKGASGVQVRGAVLETETGTPEFARAAHEISESLRRAGVAQQRNLSQPRNASERYAALYLERFDCQYQAQLQREAQMMEEAAETTDLNLPYSVSRAIIAEAYPTLVASGIFDYGLTDQSPTRLYFEKFVGDPAGEYAVVVEGETVSVTALGEWLKLANARITPGTVVIKGGDPIVTYVEGSDYVVDYGVGRIKALVGGSIAAESDVTIDYGYTAIRKGEMQAIERAKVGLSFKTLEIAADRLAAQISKEAVVFSRSQLGWDATTRTLGSLIRQIQRKIDQGALYMALTASMQVANNSGGSWDPAADDIEELVKVIGVAKTLIAKRYYAPTFVLMSVTNADLLSNWEGFRRDGMPDAVLNANGFMGRVKGLPVYESTEFPDSHILVGSRELVMHRVFQMMQLHGPYPSYNENGKLIPAEQWYAEEFNGTDAPVPEKGAHVVIS